MAPLDAAENPKRVAGANFPHLLPREPERYEKVAYVHLVGLIDISQGRLTDRSVSDLHALLKTKRRV